MNINFTARSHPGKVRLNNEDNLYCNSIILTPEIRNEPFSLSGDCEAPCMFAVCDGMGGEEYGEEASLIAVKTLKEHKINMLNNVNNFKKLDKAVQDFILDANKKLCGLMIERAVRMGTTLALAVMCENYVKCYAIGDSRIYALRDGVLRQLSHDHTLALQKVKMGLIKPEDAEHDRDRHVLTRCLGVFEDEMTPEAEVLEPEKILHDNNYRLLLCSDGLTDMLSDKHIEIILKSAPDVSTACNALSERALQAGGKDNVTCIVIDIN
ncbi:MAG: serine/threonine-protein phosphatase [Synergistaceae bacterium]|nr:serine/threonine-protein phosphatase [Synergistaceae bacterium]